jgi:hypothetical protein
MKKTIPIFVVGLLVLGGIGAIGVRVSTQREEQDNNILDMGVINTKADTYHFNDVIPVSEPAFVQQNGYLQVEVNEAHPLLFTGKPAIPVIVKTFSFQLGTKIVDIDITMKTTKYTLEYKIQPSPEPYAPTDDNIPGFTGQINPDPTVYGSQALYPSEPYTVKYGMGLEDIDEYAMFVNIRCYSQYSPARDEIFIPYEVDIDIEYDPPESQSFGASNVYDMLIITDEKFVSDLQPLVTHKNNIGIKTTMETVSSILSSYSGRFPAEKVKKRIFDAVKNWGVDYVLLAGGHVGQTNEWYVPTFESNNFDGAVSGHAQCAYDLTYDCDLYYADVGEHDQYGFLQFGDWDTNGNEIFAEGPYYDPSVDYPDYYPDVYVGRIPFRYTWEVPIVVDKIITYENTASDSWFKKAIMVGGDTSPPARDEGGNIILGIYEGELACDKTASYLSQEGFSIQKLYTSTGTFGSTDDVLNALSQGCGFVDFQGHGNPAVWGNFWPDAQTEAEFTYGFTIFDIRKLTNGNKLPVMLIDGCHNGQFNVTLQQIIDAGGIDYPRYHFLEFSPTDTSSWMLLEEGGGAIGVISTTALGYGYINQHITAGLGGWIMPRFAHAYGQGHTHLGSMWGQAIKDYVDTFDVNKDDIDRKTIEERVLFGDPSLQLGGLQASGSGNKEYNNDRSRSRVSIEDLPFTTLAADVPTWQNGQEWTYKIHSVDFSFHEVDGRDFDVQLSAGDLNLKVADASGDTYDVEIMMDNVDADLDIYFDSYTDEEPMDVELVMEDSVISGHIYFEKSTLAIGQVNLILDFSIDTDELLDAFGVELPQVIRNILLPDAIPFNVDLILDFDNSYTILQFPLGIGDSWGVEEAEITLDGTVTSRYLRILNIVNKLAAIFGLVIVPPEFAKYLPDIDISEYMTDQGIENVIELPAMEKLFRKPVFEVDSMKQVSVPAGSYSSYNVELVQGIGEFYYSADVENFVYIIGNLNDFIPIVDNLEMELIGT